MAPQILRVTEKLLVFLFKICITKLKFLKSTLTGLSHPDYFILE